MHKNLKSLIAAAGAAVSLLAGATAAHAASVDKLAVGPIAVQPALDAAAAQANAFAESRGAHGVFFDEGTQTFVVVVAPGSRLSDEEATDGIGARARVETRTITKATVAAVKERVARRAFHADAKNHSYATHLDLRTGRMVLKTDAPAEVVAPLTREFGRTISVRSEAIRDDFTRRADTSPFWGGSSITSGGGVCSSGFVVKNGNGTRYLTTAGHCFGLGAHVYTTDGGAHMGWITNRGPIPPYDMELIGGRSYGSSIFVGGTNSSTGKTVKGAGDPVVGFSNYCRSGQTTGEQCGQKVTSVDATVCTGTGCKSPVIAYTGPASAGGDSGSPFYVYTGDNAAVHIRGMHIASGGGTMYAEKWSRISSHLGVSIVTG